MSKLRSIVIIEDDPDDKDIFEQIMTDLQIPYELEWFINTEAAFHYLLTTDKFIFLIFCDINLPGANGLEFKKQIDDHPILRKKSIPFVFLSTAANQKDINTAYIEMTLQGFFKKGSNYQEMKAMIGLIIEYWSLCRHPNAI